MQQITMKQQVELHGSTYESGKTYAVNASTFRDLLAAGALKAQQVDTTTKEDTQQQTAPADLPEVPKLQPEAQAVKPVRRTRKIKK